MRAFGDSCDGEEEAFEGSVLYLLLEPFQGVEASVRGGWPVNGPCRRRRRFCNVNSVSYAHPQELIRSRQLHEGIFQHEWACL